MTVTAAGRADLTLTLDKGNITRVVFAGERILVAYHRGKRLAAFSGDGKACGAVDARELGEVVDELFPLSCGLVFGFAPWPRGTALVVDCDGRARATFKVGKFGSGGGSAFVDAGDRLVYAHDGNYTGRRILVLAL